MVLDVVTIIIVVVIFVVLILSFIVIIVVTVVVVVEAIVHGSWISDGGVGAVLFMLDVAVYYVSVGACDDAAVAVVSICRSLWCCRW